MFLKSSHLEASTFDRATVALIHADWSECIGRELEDYERAYADHLANLRALIALQDGPPRPSLLKRVFGGKVSATKSPQSLYRFAVCFSSDAFFKGAGGRAATQQQLNRIHADHLALIDQLLTQPDRTLTDTPLPRDKGTLGEAIKAALLVYFYHTDYGPQGARLSEDASLRIPKLLRYASYLSSNITASFLAHHPKLARETSALICEAYGSTAPSAEDSVWSSVALAMVGPYARRVSLGSGQKLGF